MNARVMLAAAIAVLMFGTAFAPAAISSSDDDRKIGVCVYVRELDPDDRTCVLVPRPSHPLLP